MPISRAIVEQLLVGPLTAEEMRILTIELESLVRLSFMLQDASTVGAFIDGEDVYL